LVKIHQPQSDQAQSAALLAAVVDSSWDAIISKDLSGTVTSWNPAAERIFGFSAADMIGWSIRKIVPADLQAEEDTILERIRQGRSVAAFRTLRLHADGSTIPVSVTVSPIIDEAGTVVGASKIARDLSDNSELAAQLRDSDMRFRVLADNIPQLAWMADGHGYVYWYNKRWHDYTGTTLQQVKGWGWKMVHHPDHVDRVVERIQMSWDTGAEWEDTFPLRGADGNYRWFLSRATAIRNARGEIVCWFGTNTDITEERAQQEQIRLLMREVNHRAKNMLAMIQALARRTAPAENKAFVERFEQRIQALAANQDLLMKRQWRCADVSQLVGAQLYMVDDLIGGRIRLHGPELMINPAPAETIGLAIHELCTNAAKYGALSNDVGTLDIGWGLEQTGAGRSRFWIDWLECGGPPVHEPTREGFGSTVIRRLPQLSLDVDVDMRFDPAGVRWRLSGDAATILHGGVDGQPHTSPPIESAAVGIGPVLLVEDEPLVALDLINELTTQGYWTIGPAVSVAGAEAMVARQRPACVLLDVRLGEDHSTGALAQSLREQAIPFIVLSGFMAQELETEFAGAPILKKPVQSAELLRLLATIVPRKAAS
jgi:PAS domain S-box-containing protein